MIEINKQSSDDYRFRLKSATGSTLFNSIGFSSEKEIKQTVENLTPLTNKESAFERKTDYNGKFLFNLKDHNGKIIGQSQLYRSEAGMENGIKNFKKSILSLPKN